MSAGPLPKRQAGATRHPAGLVSGNRSTRDVPVFGLRSQTPSRTAYKVGTTKDNRRDQTRGWSPGGRSPLTAQEQRKRRSLERVLAHPGLVRKLTATPGSSYWQ